MSGPYTDAPLSRHKGSQEFRLVELQPNSLSDPIRCILRAYSFDSNPPSYTALSYTWGPKVKHEIIELNGACFPVGRSLWTFLEQMRLQSRFGMYWIDAVCIDQESVLERNHQVQMMRQIYSNAHSVSIWLGEADRQATSDIAMDFLSQRQQLVTVTAHPWHTGIQYTQAYYDHMCEPTIPGNRSGGNTYSAKAYYDDVTAQIVSRRAPLETPDYPEACYHDVTSQTVSGRTSHESPGHPGVHCDRLAVQMSFEQKSEQFPWSKLQAQAVLTLYNKPYWSRIWIVQEVFLAKNLVVLCGSRQCDWRAVENLNSDIQHLQATSFPGTITEFKTSGASKLVRARLSYHSGKSNADFVEHLVSFCDLKASNRLDKVYGVWGLVEDGADFGIDYDIKPQDLLVKLLRYSWTHRSRLKGTAVIREFVVVMSEALGVRWSEWETDKQLRLTHWVLPYVMYSSFYL